MGVPVRRVRREPLGLAVLALLGALAALLVSETALRFTPYRSFLRIDPWPQHYYRPDRELGFDISPNFPRGTHRFADRAFAIWSNELGCFDRPYGGDVPYVYLAGDSFAWGFAPFEDKWGTRLEALSGVRVLKCGVSGHGTIQELRKAKQVIGKLSAPPRIIIVAYFANDLHDDDMFPNGLVYDGRLVPSPDDPSRDYDAMQARLPELYEWAHTYCNGNRAAPRALQWTKCLLARHSVLYGVATRGAKQMLSVDVLRRVGIVNDDVVPSSPRRADDTRYARHFDNLAAFRAFATAQGARLVVVLVPLGDAAPDPADLTIPYDLYPRLKAYLHAEAIESLDLTEDFRRVRRLGGGALSWSHDEHWNVRGNHLAGLLVARHVLEGSAWIAGRQAKLATVKQALGREFGIDSQ